MAVERPLSFQRKLESTTCGERVPINREIKFGMTRGEKFLENCLAKGRFGRYNLIRYGYVRYI